MRQGARDAGRTLERREADPGSWDAGLANNAPAVRNYCRLRKPHHVSSHYLILP